MVNKTQTKAVKEPFTAAAQCTHLSPEQSEPRAAAQSEQPMNQHCRQVGGGADVYLPAFFAQITTYTKTQKRRYKEEKTLPREQA